MGASNSIPSKKPVVIIIGAGYAGTTLARLLDKANNYFVLLIEKKDYFLHSVGSLRALVDPSFAPQIALPLDRLLINGLTIQGLVTNINSQEQTINLHGREEPLHYDYLVIATGSTYTFPGKTVSKSLKDVPKEYQAGNSILVAAQKIVLVGGGAVGVELAGEIATDYPSKSVTLIQRGDFLVTSEFNAKTENIVESQLRDLRVNIILKESVEISAELKEASQSTGYLAGSRQIRTSGGRTIDTDLIIFCTGTHVNSHAYATALSSSIKNDRLIVDKFFAVEKFEHIYAIGDCALVESQQAYHSGLQATHLAKNLNALFHHKKLTPYKPVEGVLLAVSIGRKGGVGQAGKSTLSKWIIVMLKSKTLTVSKIQAGLNYNPKTKTPRDISETQKENARLSLDTSDADVNKLIVGY